MEDNLYFSVEPLAREVIAMSSMLPVSRAVATIDARNELRPNPIRF